MELFRVGADVYYEESERLCRRYLALVDQIILPDNDSRGRQAQAALSHLKEIYLKLWKDAPLKVEFARRIELLERHAAVLQECFDQENEEYNAYRFCIECLSYSEKSVKEVTLEQELMDGLERVSFCEYDTLVGSFRSPRQFGICLKRKFYHIPAKYIEEYPIPKYIAIYQSERMFGRELSGIKYYGEVKKCTPIRRSRISEIPKGSNELYYKFKVKQWNRLNTPIAAKEIGFIRLFTSFFLLQNAQEVPDLTVSDRAEFVLMRLLRLASNALSEDKQLIFSAFIFEDNEVILTAESIFLCKDGGVIKRYRHSNFLNTPSTVLKDIKTRILG